jgi:hypothetical protein
MAKSKAKTPEKVSSAIDSYKKAVDDNTGKKGYEDMQKATAGAGAQMAKESLNASLDNSSKIDNAVMNAGFGSANNLTSASTTSALSKGSQMNEAQNAEARRYAAQQAQAAAAGAQSQATTAARAAGMNKAQAAMMGSQQNANAYQNAYGNAFNTQLGNAANNQNVQLSNYNQAFENNANRMNNNVLAQQQLANSNQLGQQQIATTMQGANVSGKGNVVSMEQGQDAQNYSQGGLFSDERLKHYKECSKKVVVRSPSKIKALKYTPKGE